MDELLNKESKEGDEKLFVHDLKERMNEDEIAIVKSV